MSAARACVSHPRGPARPQRTALYPVVQHHFETWLALKRAGEPW
jgi:hypothetical protein